MPCIIGTRAGYRLSHENRGEIYKIHQEMIAFVGAWSEDFRKSQNRPSGVLPLIIA